MKERIRYVIYNSYKMNKKKRNISRKTFAAGIMCNFGAIYVSTSLKTYEKPTYDHQNNYNCSSD